MAGMPCRAACVSPLRRSGWKLMHDALQWLAVPEVGLWAVFIVALVSATLLPLGSEPAVMACVTACPEAFWPAVAVATLGNTWAALSHGGWGAAPRRRTRSLSHHKPGKPGPGVAAVASGRRPVCCRGCPGGRSPLRRGRMAQAAVLAMPGLHGHRQRPCATS